MLKELKYFFLTRILTPIVFYFAKFYLSTLKLELINEDEWKTLHRQGQKILFCAWHQQFLPLINHFGSYSKNYAPAIMISKSKDGDIIADTATRWGWSVKRGSSSKDGKKALSELIEHIKGSGVGAHILDGPRGPSGVVKPGIVVLAHSSLALVVPIYVQTEKAWFFKSWDRMFLPKPFSKIKIIFDKPVRMEPTEASDEAGFEKQRLALQQLMLPHLIS